MLQGRGIQIGYIAVGYSESGTSQSVSMVVATTDIPNEKVES